MKSSSLESVFLGGFYSLKLAVLSADCYLLLSMGLWTNYTPAWIIRKAYPKSTSGPIW